MMAAPLKDSSFSKAYSSVTFSTFVGDSGNMGKPGCIDSSKILGEEYKSKTILLRHAAIA